MEEPAVRQRRLKREQYALNIAKTGRVVNQSLGRRRVDEQLRVDSLLAAAGRVITMADRAIREHEERSAAAALAAEMAPVASAAEMAVREEVEAEAEVEVEVEVEPPPAHPAAAVVVAPPALQEPVLPVTGDGARNFDRMCDDVAGMVWEELGAACRSLEGWGCARLACTCRAAWHMLREHNKKAKDRALPHGLDFWLASCLDKRQHVQLLEKRTAAETRELNPRGTVLHGCPHAKALPFGPYHVDDFDSVVVVVCPTNPTDDFRIGE